METPVERRLRQRFVAKRRGEVCFWILLDEAELPAEDLSLEGFGISAEFPVTMGKVVPVTLKRAGVPDRIKAFAHAVNCSGDGIGAVVGFVFDRFEDDGAVRLQDWLTAHVLACATVKISEADASKIVSGPSLI